MGWIRRNLVGRLVDWIREKVSAPDLDEIIEAELGDGGVVEVRESGVEVEPPSDSSFHAKRLRRSSYKGMSESKLASRATENYMVFSDVVSDPGLVGAESEVEAVAAIAANDPGWASFVDFESDLGLDPGEVEAAADGDVKDGQSRHGDTGYSSEGSESGSSTGGVETASESAYTPSGPDAHADVSGSSDSGGSGVSSGGDVGGESGGAVDGGGGDV